MARTVSQRGARTGQCLRLAEQFQLVRISTREYRLVSLFDSLAIQTPEGTDGVLDRVLPALHRGANLKTIMNGASRRERAAIRRAITDLMGRGLAVEASDVAAPAAGSDRYQSQRQFFANFQSLAPIDPGAKAAGPGSSDPQTQLRGASVLVVGLGRFGSRVCNALAAAGVGKIIGADDGVVTSSDLADSAYAASDLGHAREEAVRQRISGTNPLVTYLPLARPLFGPHGVETPDGLDLLALCDDRFDPSRHAAVNRACLDNNIPWIGYRSHGTRIEIGPTVIPHETACYRCYELRRASNFEGFEEERELRARLAATETGLGALNITFGADLLALEVLKTLTHFTTAGTYGAVYGLDVVSMESRLRPLLKIPRCPACGRSAGKPAANIWRYDLDGDAGGF